MLFQKKNKFEILDSQIKEELKNSDGITILKINIRYPHIQCGKKDPLSADARDFYLRLSKSLEAFAKTDLYQKALRSYNEDKEGFLPYAMVMRWENTFLDKSYLSVLLDISVSHGKNPPTFRRETQIWRRSDGKLSRFKDFFPREDVKALFPDAPKQFQKSNFVLRDGGYEFFLSDGSSRFVAS